MSAGATPEGWRVEIEVPAMTIRVLIADDQPVVRDGLAMLLGLIDDVEIVATAADGIEAVERARSERPDIVLMDLRMPRLEGAEATRQILASLPDTRVLVLTTYADDEFLFPALQAGARGYLTKDATAEEIEHAIRALIAGQTHLDPAVQQRLVTAVLDQTPPTPATDPAPASPPDLPDELTPREVEVLKLIAAGLSNTEIADAAGPQQRHRQDPHQPDLLQDRRPRPRPSRPLRLPAPPGIAAHRPPHHYRRAPARSHNTPGNPATLVRPPVFAAATRPNPDGPASGAAPTTTVSAASALLSADTGAPRATGSIWAGAGDQ